MAFLNKIQQYLNQRKNADFKKSIHEEKKQKYLFRDAPEAKYKPTREPTFAKGKKQLTPFTSTITDNFLALKRNLFEAKILGTIGILLLSLSGYIIFFSPYFRLSPSKVFLESVTPGIDISIAYRSIEGIYGKNIFLLDENTVAKELKKNIKNITHISINKLYPNGLTIIITGAPIQYDVTIHGLDKNWGMSTNGVLIPKNEVQTGGLTPFTISSSILKGEVFLDYRQVINEENMLLVSKIYDIFHSEWKDFTIERAIYFDMENELHIILNNKTTIILTLEDNSNKTDYAVRTLGVKKELIGLKTYIDANRDLVKNGDITYIDARVIKKLFICRERNTCSKNLITIYGDVYR